MVVSLPAGIATGWGTDTFVGISDIWGSWHDDELVGNADANEILGRGGDDVIRAGKGDDLVIGEEGSMSSTESPVTTPSTPTCLWTGRRSTTTPPTSFEAAPETTSSCGALGNDTLRGGPGDDELFGIQGNDYLDGGDGSDELDGGPDDDECTRGEIYKSCELIL